MFIVRTFLVLVTVYRVENINFGTKTTNDVKLYPPWSTTYRYVNENYRVICRCFEPYTEIKWTNLEGKPIPESGAKTYAHIIQSGTVLIFKNITKEAEGGYECIALDKTKNRVYSNRFILNVAEPIVFNSPTIYEAVLNENILLECKVNEKQTPERHWEFKGHTLSSVERYQYGMEGVLILNVGLHDAGKYYCVISHSPFQSNRNRLEITLVVYYKPIAWRVSSTIYGFVDEILTIPCRVNANPSAWFIWYNKYMAAIDPKKDNITIITEENMSTLQVLITEYTSRTETKFICEACNELGCTEQTVHVKTTPKLTAPTIGLWDIDSDSADFFISTQSEATLYIFQYFFDVDEDTKWDKALSQNYSTVLPRAKLDSYVKYEVDNLHPDTNYILRVAAANHYTISEFSTERAFKTRVGRTVHTYCNSSSNLRMNFVMLILSFFNCFPI